MGRVIHTLEAWAPVAVVLVLAMVTTWLWRVVESNENLQKGGLRHDPDLIMSGFVARQLSETGQVRYTLTADQMVHYPDDDTSHFSRALFTSIEPGSPATSVRSEQAVRSEKKDEVVFSGNVIMTREAAAEQPQTVMTTARLVVYPQQGIEKTDQPVVVDDGTNHLTATAMIINNKTKIGQFTHAKATYLPNTHRH